MTLRYLAEGFGRPQKNSELRILKILLYNQNKAKILTLIRLSFLRGVFSGGRLNLNSLFIFQEVPI